MSLQPWRWSWRSMPLPRGSSRGARARLAALRGKQVAMLPGAAYGGHNELRDHWLDAAMPLIVEGYRSHGEG
jgi:hypothetical protein